MAGGRDTELVVGAPPRYASAGLGRAWSDDGVRWTWQGTEPLVGWNLTPEPGVPPDRDWRHWARRTLCDKKAPPDAPHWPIPAEWSSPARR